MKSQGTGLRYQIKDHLGSVRGVVYNTGGGLIETSSYTPYGSRSEGLISALSTTEETRYHFTGKEDQSPAFNVSYTDFGARHYSPSLFRWLVPDPLSEQYYDVSPYAYCAGDPVNMVDPDGRTIRIWYYQDGDLLYFTYSGEEDESTIPDNDYVNAVIGAYKYNKHQWMAAGFNGESPSTTLVENKDILVNVFSKLEYDTQYYRGNGGIQNIIWNPYEGSSTDEGYVISPATIFAHEADHAIDDAMDAVSHSARVSSLIEPFGNEEERRVITGSEQKSAIANGDITRGQVTRRNHRGKTIYTISPVSPIIDLEATRYFRNHYKR